MIMTEAGQGFGISTDESAWACTFRRSVAHGEQWANQPIWCM